MSIGRFFLSLDNLELANTSRVIETIGGLRGVPDSDDIFNDSRCGCRNMQVTYDDSWPLLRDYLGHAPYVASNSPWYNGTQASEDFHGIWLLNVEGAEATDFTRDISDAICHGGVAGRSLDSPKELKFEALLWACTNKGAQFGLRWLECQLRYASRGLRELNFFDYHPEDGDVSEGDEAWRSYRNVVYSERLSVSDTLGRPVKGNHQNSVYRVKWGFVALDPYAWRKPTPWQPITSVTSTVEDIDFGPGAPCEDVCTEVTPLTSATCPPSTLRVVASDVPRCGFCYGVCDYTEYVYSVDLTGLSQCDVIAPQIQIHNPSTTTAFSGHFFWRPALSIDPCEEVGNATVSGLPPESTVMLDAVSGKSYAIPDVLTGDQHPTLKSRERGIVGTLTGAPWAASLLTSDEWELVIHTESAMPDVSIRYRERML